MTSSFPHQTLTSPVLLAFELFLGPLAFCNVFELVFLYFSVDMIRTLRTSYGGQLASLFSHSLLRAIPAPLEPGFSTRPQSFDGVVERFPTSSSVSKDQPTESPPQHCPPIILFCRPYRTCFRRACSPPPFPRNVRAFLRKPKVFGFMVTLRSLGRLARPDLDLSHLLVT